MQRGGTIWYSVWQYSSTTAAYKVSGGRCQQRSSTFTMVWPHTIYKWYHGTTQMVPWYMYHGTRVPWYFKSFLRKCCICTRLPVVPWHHGTRVRTYVLATSLPMVEYVPKRVRTMVHVYQGTMVVSIGMAYIPI